MGAAGKDGTEPPKLNKDVGAMGAAGKDGTEPPKLNKDVGAMGAAGKDGTEPPKLNKDVGAMGAAGKDALPRDAANGEPTPAEARAANPLVDCVEKCPKPNAEAIGARMRSCMS